MKKLLPTLVFFLLLIFFFVSPVYAQCGPSATDRNSWPDDCHDYIYQGRFCPLCANQQEICNRTQYMIPYCAQSFEAHQTIEVSKQDCEYECDGKWWAQQNWKGTITIDPTETKVPFAGKKKEAVDSEIHEDEIKYLADYFEGTHEYYRDYPLRLTLGPFTLLTYGHGVNQIFMTNFQGVLRKLAPYEYQNQRKKQMVERAIASNNGQLQYGAIHNYQLNYLRRLCWNAPFWLHVLEAFAERFKLTDPIEAWRVLDYCLYYLVLTDKALMNLIHSLVLNPLNIPHWKEEGVKDYLSTLDGHFPPEPDEEDYVEKWNAWKESNDGYWFKLWQVAPMVTREDTLAYIKPDPQLRDYPGEYWAGPTEVGIRVPHLARLFETSRWVQQILLPLDPNLERTSDQELLAKANSVTSPKVLGSSNEGSCGSNGQVLGEKTYLAQNQWDACDPDGDCCATITIQSICCSKGAGTVVIDGRGCGHAWVTINGQFVGINALGPGMTYHFGCPTDPGATVNVSVVVVNYDIPVPGGHYTVSSSCSMTLDQDGAACCDGGPPIPSCHKPPVPQSPKCVEPAITDTNPNDEICSPKITGELSAMEEIENPYCEECMEVDCILYPTHHCCGYFTVDVYRQMEVKTELPYLSQSWDHSTDPLQGFFNIFRPAVIPQFEDTPAKSQIKYDFKPGNAVPEVGDFYYPFLGGVQLGKEWVIEALTPYVE